MLVFTILLAVFSASGMGGAVLAQQITITGTVLDDLGDPLPGASVTVRGTNTGVTTDADGTYRIAAPDESAVLTFSFVGFQTVAITVGAQRQIDVVMYDDAQAFDELVVIGYGVQRKMLVTGATAQVRGETLQRLNTTSPLQAMQGQLPGVSIISTSGQPGADMRVTIRGLGTVGNANPLFLIDGISGDISLLNPADIESVDVLKDAASAAIYGAQAANGVVLITTRQGREGRAQVSFDAYYGVQTVARKIRMLNAQEYKVIMDEQSVNSGGNIYNWDSYESIRGVDTDWIGAMFKDNAKTQSYSLSVTGGSATSTYALSLGYMSQEGVIGGRDVSNYERFNFRINSEHRLLNGHLKVGEQVSFVYRPTTGISVGNQYNNTLRSAFNVSPLAPVYSDNNIYDSPFNDTSNSDWYNADGNPYGVMMTNTNNLNQNRTFSGNVYAEVEPLRNLRVRTLFGAVFGASESRSFTPFYQFSIYSYNNTRTSVNQNMSQGTTLTWTNTASYDFNINQHRFNALIGMESQLNEGTNIGGGRGILREGFDTWEYAYINNATSTTMETGLSVSGSPHTQNRRVSYFGRIGYNLDDKYLLNATLRADGSSRFAKGNRFGYFPSVSAGWIVSSESFMEATSAWMHYAKLRASWGQVGNQNIGAFQYLSPISSTNNDYLFGTTRGAAAQANYWGSFPSRLGNEKLRWETSEQLNIGFDATLIRKLNVNFDYYVKNTKDWLVQPPILATAGTGAPYINGGDVKNTGVELSLNWTEKRGQDFSYFVGFSGSYNKNTVGNIPNEDGIIHGQTNQLYDNSLAFYRAENGHPIGFFWGYKTDGIFQNQQEIDAWIAAGNGTLQANPRPGDVKYVDLNGFNSEGDIVEGRDGTINDADKVNLGNGMPKITFGFNFGFNYKGFDFLLNANGAVGNYIVQSYRNHGGGGIVYNYPTSILNRWTGEGTSNTTPRVTNTNINWQFSDLMMQKGDYLRINNITLGYDLSKFVGAGFNQVRLYVQIQNPFTFTKYDGMDPEIGYGMDAWVMGIDLGYYPRPRTILGGVNIKF